MEKIEIEDQAMPIFLWVAAWLFTIGFLGLGFWQGLLAIVIWPYYIGAYLSTLIR